MRARNSIAVAIAICLGGCTIIEIHGANRVDTVRKLGLAWAVNVQASEPLLIQRTSIGVDVSSHELILGYRRLRSVYRPESINCHVLVVVDGQSDAKEAVHVLERGLSSNGVSFCVMGN